MRSSGIILWALAVLTICSFASATQDAKVYGLCESNLSINLSQGFRIVPDESITSSGGYLSQTFTVGNSRMKGTAMLHIMDVYDEDTKLLGSDYISDLWKMGIGIAASPGAASLLQSMEEDDEETAILRAIEEYSDRSIGNWTATDNFGNNVTIDTLSTEGGIFSMFGKTADI